MRKPTRIHQNRTTFRRHYLREWLEEREMSAMDLLDLLNEAADMETQPLDKSQVYRWLRGQLPHRPTQVRIAAALELNDPETGEPNPEILMMHPAMSFLAERVDVDSPEDMEKLRQLVEITFPHRTGTDD
jgi:hypothetical protein